MGFIKPNLKRIMYEKNLSIQDVKDHTTLSRTTISNLFNNNVNGIQFDTLAQLCKFLDCNTEDLLTYVKLELDFEVIEESIDFSLSNNSESIQGANHEYSSNLDMLINLKINNDDIEIGISTYVEYLVDENNVFYEIFINLISDRLRKQLSKHIPHSEAYDYVCDNLCTYLIDWGFNYLKNGKMNTIANKVNTNIVKF